MKRLVALAVAAALVATGFTLWAHSSSTAEVVADGVPAAPTAVRTFPIIDGLGILWSPSTETGGQVESYLVQVQRSNGTWGNASQDLPADTLRWVDKNLQAGNSVAYRVIALNADGQSPPSATVTGTRPAADPSVGDTEILMIDANLGGTTSWLSDELAKPVSQSSADTTRTLSAGAVQLTLPGVFPGPGTYPVGPGKHSLMLRQTDRECSLDGTLTVAELAYTADLRVETMSARFAGSCEGVSSVHGEIRVNSTKPYAALSIDTPRVDFGRLTTGSARQQASATVKNIGLTTLSVFPQPLGADDNWYYVGGSGSSCGTLTPGQTCTITVSFYPEYAQNYTKVVELSDTTSRMEHHIRFSASVMSNPRPPLDVTARSTFSGVDLSWVAAFWGNAKPTAFVVHRSLDGIDTTFTLPPDQLEWTEPLGTGSRLASYHVTAVNEVGESLPSGRATPLPAREELAVFAGLSDQPMSLGGVAIPSGRQIVPTEKAPTGERTELTSAPNGVDLAYILADGDNNALWIRRTVSGAISDTQLRSATGISHPAWSADGARIAFTAAGDNSTTCVDVITIADGSVVRVGCGLDFPAWHSDGRTLIVQDKRLTGAPLARMEARENAPRLATLPGSAGATRATISPTGTWLAYQPAGKPTQIGFLPLDGGTPKITDTGYKVEALSWDTTGNRLAVLIPSSSGNVVRHVDARAVMTDDYIVVWGDLYGGPEHIEDISWQGRRVVIGATPGISGPSVSIPFDTTALGGSAVHCTLDGVDKGECTSPFTAAGLSSGTHHLQVRAFSGSYPNHYLAVTTRSFTVDATGPVARVVAPTYEVSTAGTATVKYSASDTSGAVSYDVRYRKASYLSGFGAYVQPWTATTATSVNLNVDPGYEYCVSVRAKDKLGNLGAWSAEKCFARPMDDRAISAPTAGWSRTSWSAFYLGTATQTTSYGASLTRTVQGKRFYVVATKCPTCGLVAVYAGGKYIGAVNLASATTQRQAVIPLPAQSTLFSGTLTFTVRSATGKFVQIDGLAVRRS